MQIHNQLSVPSAPQKGLPFPPCSCLRAPQILALHHQYRYFFSTQPHACTRTFMFRCPKGKRAMTHQVWSFHEAPSGADMKLGWAVFLPSLHTSIFSVPEEGIMSATEHHHVGLNEMLYAVCLVEYDDVWKENILPTVCVQPMLHLSLTLE